ncbi:MAF protein [Marinospirillum celere]|uniref:7-methyl-GTP pyrophosphatase n=1 Tax=Marinospirillum celere TaxID=1122252 RepID=A0A1I1JV04_9GAMM|nr:nucleoside triphosphate pyrophosphatase [Marinospirillum celere]SFC52205.1 MAF protein [Marinospirillum celere]
MPELLLASSSPYRRQLLEKLGLPFHTASPDIDESPQADETPSQLVERLAISKAKALAGSHPDKLIIGSDQVCSHQGQLLGKPGSRDGAIQQLMQLQGQPVSFYTGLCLYNATTEATHSLVDLFSVEFRSLSEQQICNYVDRESPLDCAGSFKSEGLGIALFKRLEGDDPNSLVGLPLIRLVELLKAEGVDPLNFGAAEPSTQPKPL